MQEFWNDEKGQATTEYVLLLSIIFALLVMVINKLIKPTYVKLVASVSANFEKQLFGGNFHTFRVR